MALLSWLRLLRAGTLFSPAADGVAGLCLADAAWNADAVRIVAAGVCLYAGGMVLNDFADRREDAVRRPERPLPRGDIAPTAALLLGALLLGAGCALSPVPAWHAGMAALVLCYDFASKHNALAGALTMGLLRGCNLAAAAVAAGMVTKEVVTAALAYGVYILAVTLLGIQEDVAAPAPGTVRALLAAPPVAVLAALGIVQGGVWPAPALACVPVAAFTVRAARVAGWNQRSIRGAMLWLLLGTMVYTSLLCVARARWPEAAAILAAIVPARLIARAIALT
jgi:UbiA prenyltransferase family